MSGLIAQYRVVFWGKPCGPWRFDSEAAIEDAIAKKAATRDDHVEKRIWWEIGAVKQERKVPAVCVIVPLPGQAA